LALTLIIFIRQVTSEEAAEDSYVSDGGWNLTRPPVGSRPWMRPGGPRLRLVPLICSVFRELINRHRKSNRRRPTDSRM